jgi:hypothetical protein
VYFDALAPSAFSQSTLQKTDPSYNFVFRYI